MSHQANLTPEEEHDKKLKEVGFFLISEVSNLLKVVTKELEELILDSNHKKQFVPRIGYIDLIVSGASLKNKRVNVHSLWNSMLMVEDVPPYISLKWTANILSRSEPHISYLCRNGKLRSLKVAGSRIICRDSLREHAIEKGLDCTILGLRDALNPASEIYDIHSKAFFG